MKILIALALATTLFAENDGQLEEVFPLAVEETGEYFSSDLFVNEEIESAEYLTEMEESEIADLTPEMEIESQSSLQGMVEKQTARVLQNQDDEQLPKEIDPQVEDLSLLVQKPTVTFAEPAEETEVQNPYDALPITIEEKQKIATILVTMAENNIFQLLFERKHLERLGQEINHVHPIRFIGTVFTDQRLSRCMGRIKRSGFKWDGFMDGFSERLLEEVKARNVNAYVPGLAESLQVDPEVIQAYVNRKDFRGLISFLIEQTNQPR